MPRARNKNISAVDDDTTTVSTRYQNNFRKKQNLGIKHDIPDEFFTNTAQKEPHLNKKN